MDDAIPFVVSPMVAAMVGLLKTFGPAATPPWASLTLAAVAAAALIALGIWSGEVEGTMLGIAGQWMQVVLGAIGARELFRRTAGDEALRFGVGRTGGFTEGS